MTDLNKNDEYVIPICGVGKDSCEEPKEICNVAFRLVRPCIEESGSESGSGSGEEEIDTSPLFDLSSWNNGQFPDLVEPFKTMLDLAAERWNKLLDYRPDAMKILKDYYKEVGRDWNGCFMSSFTVVNDSQSPFIAFCGPSDYVSVKDEDEEYRSSLADAVTYYPPYLFTMAGKAPLNDPESRMCFNSASFHLEINAAYFNPEDEYNNTLWLNVMTHELGHAIGFGLFWHLGLYGQWDPSRTDFCWLDSTLYINTIGLWGNLIGYPVEDDGEGGTAGAHWEMFDRAQNDYGPCGGQGYFIPGLGQSCASSNDQNTVLPTCDIMIGWISMYPISDATIGLFKDFGYKPTGISDVAWTLNNTPTNIPPYNPQQSILANQQVGLRANLLPKICEHEDGSCTLDGQFKFHCRCHK